MRRPLLPFLLLLLLRPFYFESETSHWKTSLRRRRISGTSTIWTFPLSRSDQSRGITAFHSAVLPELIIRQTLFGCLWLLSIAWHCLEKRSDSTWIKFQLSCVWPWIVVRFLFISSCSSSMYREKMALIANLIKLDAYGGRGYSPVIN